MSIKTTEYVLYSEGGAHYRIRAKYGLDYDFARRNKQAPYFSITGEIDRATRGSGGFREDSGGMLHDQIGRHFPRLRPYQIWHLTGLNGPMHYIANAKYWWELYTGTFRWESKKGDPDPKEAFKSTIVFGALGSDRMPPQNAPWSEVKDWLEARLPAVMDQFQTDMDELGVLER